MKKKFCLKNNHSCKILFFKSNSFCSKTVKLPLKKKIHFLVGKNPKHYFKKLSFHKTIVSSKQVGGFKK